ncbi:hypothetical protein GCM10010836_18380 [Aminobacter aminovorans]
MVSTDLPRPIEPVVILEAPQPATLAISSVSKAILARRFPVAFIERLVNIGDGSPFVRVAVHRPFPRFGEIFC